MPDVRPDFKTASRTKQPTKRGRARTSPREWRGLHFEKGGPCRLCGDRPYELHHLLSRARGGPDQAWNLVPLCNRHHSLVTAEHPETLAALAASLTDAEYAGLVTLEGEGVLARLFGVLAASGKDTP